MTRKASKQKAIEQIKLNKSLSLKELTILQLTSIDKIYDDSNNKNLNEPKVSATQAITYIAPVITGLTPLAVIFCLGPQSEERVDQLVSTLLVLLLLFFEN